MYDCIKKLIDLLLDDVKGSNHTSAPEYIFRTDDEETTKLLTDLSDLFHKHSTSTMG